MRILRALEELGVKNKSVSVKDKKVELETDDINKVLKKMEEIGYPAKLEG